MRRRLEIPVRDADTLVRRVPRIDYLRDAHAVWATERRERRTRRAPQLNPWCAWAPPIGRDHTAIFAVSKRDPLPARKHLALAWTECNSLDHE